MLKYWTTHDEYQHFLSLSVPLLSPQELKRFIFLKDSIDKLSSLNFDPAMTLITPYYSSTGRPALHQPKILRSFVLMMDQEVLSLTKWVDILASDHLLALLVGLPMDQLPPLGSYYDLIDRLWLRNSSLDRQDSKKLFHFPKNTRPLKSPAKAKSFLTAIRTSFLSVPLSPIQAINSLSITKNSSRKSFLFLPLSLLYGSGSFRTFL